MQADKGDKRLSDMMLILNLVQDACLMLFDQAQMMEGKLPDDPTKFAKRMTRLMERGLAG